MTKCRRPRKAFHLSAIVAATAMSLIPLPAIAQAPSHGEPASSSGEVRYIKSSRVNVRSGPGTSHSALDVITLGNEVRVYLTRGEWSRISAPGQTERWVYTPLLQDSAPRPPKAVSKAAQKSPTDTRNDEPTRQVSPQGDKSRANGAASRDRSVAQKQQNGTPENEQDMHKPR